MNKAGFEFVGQLSFKVDGKVGLSPYPDSTERARLGADLLQVLPYPSSDDWLPIFRKMESLDYAANLCVVFATLGR